MTTLSSQSSLGELISAEVSRLGRIARRGTIARGPRWAAEEHQMLVAFQIAVLLKLAKLRYRLLNEIRLQRETYLPDDPRYDWATSDAYELESYGHRFIQPTSVTMPSW